MTVRFYDKRENDDASNVEQQEHQCDVVSVFTRRVTVWRIQIEKSAKSLSSLLYDTGMVK